VYKDEKVIDVVLGFISREIASGASKPTVYWCEAFANDYDKSFRSAAEALVLKLSPPESTGKHLWINLTGGTNVMNAALLQAAFLSGLTARAYYTFVLPQMTDYLQPAGERHFSYHEVPLIKTVFDESYYDVFEVLKTLEDWVSSEDLLCLLKNQRPEYFEAVDLNRLKKEFLNKMDGHGLEREVLPDGNKGDKVRISNEGKELLRKIHDPVFCALTQRGQTDRFNAKFTYGWEKLTF
jgi:hypothetical protein